MITVEDYNISVNTKPEKKYSRQLTNVFSARRSSRNPVYSALYAITKSKRIVILADNFSALVLDCFNSALARPRSNDVQRYCKVFRTLP